MATALPISSTLHGDYNMTLSSVPPKQMVKPPAVLRAQVPSSSDSIPLRANLAVHTLKLGAQSHNAGGASITPAPPAPVASHSAAATTKPPPKKRQRRKPPAVPSNVKMVDTSGPEALCMGQVLGGGNRVGSLIGLATPATARSLTLWVRTDSLARRARELAKAQGAPFGCEFDAPTIGLFARDGNEDGTTKEINEEDGARRKKKTFEGIARKKHGDEDDVLSRRKGTQRFGDGSGGGSSTYGSSSCCSSSSSSSSTTSGSSGASESSDDDVSSDEDCTSGQKKKSRKIKSGDTTSSMDESSCSAIVAKKDATSASMVTTVADGGSIPSVGVNLGPTLIQQNPAAHIPSTERIKSAAELLHGNRWLPELVLLMMPAYKEAFSGVRLIVLQLINELERDTDALMGDAASPLTVTTATESEAQFEWSTVDNAVTAAILSSSASAPAARCSGGAGHGGGGQDGRGQDGGNNSRSNHRQRLHGNSMDRVPTQRDSCGQDSIFPRVTVSEIGTASGDPLGPSHHLAQPSSVAVVSAAKIAANTAVAVRRMVVPPLPSPRPRTSLPGGWMPREVAEILRRPVVKAQRCGMLALLRIGHANRQTLRKERESIFKAAGASGPFLSPLGSYGFPSSPPTSGSFSIAAPDSASNDGTLSLLSPGNQEVGFVVSSEATVLAAAANTETQEKPPLAQAADRLHDSLLRAAVRSATRRREHSASVSAARRALSLDGVPQIKGESKLRAKRLVNPFDLLGGSVAGIDNITKFGPPAASPQGFMALHEMSHAAGSAPWLGKSDAQANGAASASAGELWRLIHENDAATLLIDRSNLSDGSNRHSLPHATVLAAQLMQRLATEQGLWGPYLVVAPLRPRKYTTSIEGDLEEFQGNRGEGSSGASYIEDWEEALRLFAPGLHVLSYGAYGTEKLSYFRRRLVEMLGLLRTEGGSGSVSWGCGSCYCAESTWHVLLVPYDVAVAEVVHPCCLHVESTSMVVGDREVSKPDALFPVHQQNTLRGEHYDSERGKVIKKKNEGMDCDAVDSIPGSRLMRDGNHFLRTKKSVHRKQRFSPFQGRNVTIGKSLRKPEEVAVAALSECVAAEAVVAARETQNRRMMATADLASKLTQRRPLWSVGKGRGLGDAGGCGVSDSGKYFFYESCSDCSDDGHLASVASGRRVSDLGGATVAFVRPTLCWQLVVLSDPLPLLADPAAAPARAALLRLPSCGRLLVVGSNGLEDPRGDGGWSILRATLRGDRARAKAEKAEMSEERRVEERTAETEKHARAQLEEIKAIGVARKQFSVLACPNLSNPYHVCGEYCSAKYTEGGQGKDNTSGSAERIETIAGTATATMATGVGTSAAAPPTPQDDAATIHSSGSVSVSLLPTMLKSKKDGADGHEKAPATSPIFDEEEETFAEDDVEKLVEVEMGEEKHEDCDSMKGDEIQEDRFTGLPALETLRSLSLGLLPDHYSILRREINEAGRSLTEAEAIVGLGGTLDALEQIEKNNTKSHTGASIAPLLSSPLRPSPSAAVPSLVRLLAPQIIVHDPYPEASALWRRRRRGIISNGGGDSCDSAADTDDRDENSSTEADPRESHIVRLIDPDTRHLAEAALAPPPGLPSDKGQMCSMEGRTGGREPSQHAAVVLALCEELAAAASGRATDRGALTEYQRPESTAKEKEQAYGTGNYVIPGPSTLSSSTAALGAQGNCGSLLLTRFHNRMALERLEASGSSGIAYAVAADEYRRDQESTESGVVKMEGGIAEAHVDQEKSIARRRNTVLLRSGHGADINSKQGNWDGVKLPKLSPVATELRNLDMDAVAYANESGTYFGPRISAEPCSRVEGGANNLKERRLPPLFSTTVATTTSPSSSSSVEAIVLEPDKRSPRSSATLIGDGCWGGPKSFDFPEEDDLAGVVYPFLDPTRGRFGLGGVFGFGLFGFSGVDGSHSSGSAGAGGASGGSGVGGTGRGVGVGGAGGVVLDLSGVPDDIAPMPRQRTTGPVTSSKFRGVCRSKRTATDKWQAQISYGGTNYYLGLFDSEEEAGVAYARAHFKFYGPGKEAKPGKLRKGQFDKLATLADECAGNEGTIVGGDGRLQHENEALLTAMNKARVLREEEAADLAYDADTERPLYSKAVLALLHRYCAAIDAPVMHIRPFGGAEARLRRIIAANRAASRHDPSAMSLAAAAAAAAALNSDTTSGGESMSDGSIIRGVGGVVATSSPFSSLCLDGTRLSLSRTSVDARHADCLSSSAESDGVKGDAGNTAGFDSDDENDDELSESDELDLGPFPQPRHGSRSGSDGGGADNIVLTEGLSVPVERPHAAPILAKSAGPQHPSFAYVVGGSAAIKRKRNSAPRQDTGRTMAGSASAAAAAAKAATLAAQAAGVNITTLQAEGLSNTQQHIHKQQQQFSNILSLASHPLSQAVTGSLASSTTKRSTIATTTTTTTTTTNGAEKAAVVAAAAVAAVAASGPLECRNAAIYSAPPPPLFADNDPASAAAMAVAAKAAAAGVANAHSEKSNSLQLALSSTEGSSSYAKEKKPSVVSWATALRPMVAAWRTELRRSISSLGSTVVEVPQTGIRSLRPDEGVSSHIDGDVLNASVFKTSEGKSSRVAYARLVGTNPSFIALMERPVVSLGNGHGGGNGESWRRATEAVLGSTIPPGVAVGEIDIHLGTSRIAVSYWRGQ